MLVKAIRDFPDTPSREIPLGKDLVALVDEDLFYELSKYHWYAKKSFSKIYAVRTFRKNRKKHFIKMHRQIAETPEHMVTHHINHNSLDNRRANLLNMTLFDHTKEHSWR